MVSVLTCGKIGNNLIGGGINDGHGTSTTVGHIYSLIVLVVDGIECTSTSGDGGNNLLSFGTQHDCFTGALRGDKQVLAYRIIGNTGTRCEVLRQVIDGHLVAVTQINLGCLGGTARCGK